MRPKELLAENIQGQTESRQTSSKRGSANSMYQDKKDVVGMGARLGPVAIYIYEGVRVCEGLLIWVREDMHKSCARGIRGMVACRIRVVALMLVKGPVHGTAQKWPRKAGKKAKDTAPLPQ